MRRVSLALVLLGLLLPACASTERPEGIVERWLLSLNQGAAGEPERYATDALSDAVLHDWAELEPGQLDEIDVGDATALGDGSFSVPFRVVNLDGAVATAFAILEPTPTGLRIVRARSPDLGPGLHEDFAVRSAEPMPAAAWVAAAGVAALLIALTAGLMALVPGRRPDD